MQGCGFPVSSEILQMNLPKRYATERLRVVLVNPFQYNFEPYLIQRSDLLIPRFKSRKWPLSFTFIFLENPFSFAFFSSSWTTFIMGAIFSYSPLLSQQLTFLQAQQPVYRQMKHFKALCFSLLNLRMSTSSPWVISSIMQPRMFVTDSALSVSALLSVLLYLQYSCLLGVTQKSLGILILGPGSLCLMILMAFTISCAQQLIWGLTTIVLMGSLDSIGSIPSPTGLGIQGIGGGGGDGGGEGGRDRTGDRGGDGGREGGKDKTGRGGGQIHPM